ncbi:MAG: hypothetical protein L6R37_001269 [Teloschistes peruensis]|nr:MAG: hypothetical protein L6R37_001269 [Teloschistes peruensis]
MSTTSSPTYKSHLSIPYTIPPLPLRTLDIHIPTTTTPPPPTSSTTPTPPPPPHTYTIIYIHGGAFRDPLVTSQSLLPSLPHLKLGKIAAIVSVNYSLCPYPTHLTHPSKPRGGGGEEEGRAALWPDQVADVRAALEFLFGDIQGDEVHPLHDDDFGGRGFRDAIRASETILVGHSVGATIGFALAMEITDRVHDEGAGDAIVGIGRRIRAVVGVEGIYDFTALRDAHVEYRDGYEEFTSEAFGAEEDGGWERGNMVEAVRKRERMLEGVEVVVLGHKSSNGKGLAEGGKGKGKGGRKGVLGGRNEGGSRRGLAERK